MKIRFESNGDLSLGKILTIPTMNVVVKSVSQKENKYYAQVYLHGRGYRFVSKL